MNNRSAAEKYILEFCKDIEPTGYNVEIYKKVFKRMSDKEFEEYMIGIRDGKKYLVLFKPMYKAEGISVENNLAISEKYGVKFFERLIISENKDIPEHTTPIEYLVLELPYRRQSQTLDKKISLPDDNRVIDTLSYQPTGPSKGAKISYPELQVLIGMGLDNSISELIKYRGGDKGGFNAYNAMMNRHGSVNLKTLSSFATGVESTKTLKAYLLAAHINNTI